MKRRMKYFAFKIDASELHHRMNEKASEELHSRILSQGVSGVYCDPYKQYEAFLFPDRESMIASYYIAVELGFATAGIIPMMV